MSRKPATIDEVREALSGFQPFTITVSNTEDLMFLFNALVFQAARCNKEAANGLADLIGTAMGEFGPEKGAEEVRRFFTEVNATNIPKWFYPLMVHIYSHVKNKRDTNDK